MKAGDERDLHAAKGRTTVERTSDREVVVTRTIDGPARLVFEAWTKPELLKRWWVPKSAGLPALLSWVADVRAGGAYRLEFATEPAPMAFFGKYLEVTPHSRLVWTNEESGEGSITTVTFEERGGKTLVVLRELYPSKEALEAGIGSTDGLGESFDQLEDLVTTLR